MHASLALAQDLPWESYVELTGYYKELWRLISPSSELVVRDDGDLRPESFANTGAGRIYGMELLLRKNLSDNLFGWVSYTLSRSTRVDAPGQPRRPRASTSGSVSPASCSPSSTVTRAAARPSA
jgi:hypothetical protein